MNRKPITLPAMAEQCQYTATEGDKRFDNIVATISDTIFVTNTSEGKTYLNEYRQIDGVWGINDAPEGIEPSANFIVASLPIP